MGNRNHRRGGRRRNGERSQQQRAEKEPIVHPTCPICEKPIRDISSAMASKDTGEPCHFDCVLKDLVSKEQLASDERIVYLGKGTFGVIQQARHGSPRFQIRRKIVYENQEQKQDWRKKLSGRISSLTN